MSATTLLAGVVESDVSGCVSNAATLRVADGQRLTIVQQPKGSWIEQGYHHTFVVETVNGVGTISYQWRFNGEPILGATLDSYTVDPATIGDAGEYDCLVSDDYINLTTSTATLRVADGNLPTSGLYGLGVLLVLLSMFGAYRQRRQTR